jgi:hypothetical protein
MKRLFVLLLVALISFHSFSQSVIFLHHSTGGNVWNEGNVNNYIQDFNTQNGTSIKVTETSYPNDPYPWENYPYDFWNLWVNGQCDDSKSGIECLSSLAGKYNLIIFKHCFPGAGISSDTGTPDVTSSRKSLENYKLQYRALRQIMDSFPNNKFMVWTLAPLHRNATTETQASRARQFVDWVKNDWLKEDGKQHNNIYIFDFYNIVAESDPNPVQGNVNCLKYEFEGDHTGSDSHPNTKANQIAGPLFAQAIENCLLDIKNILTESITIQPEEGKFNIDIPGGSLKLNVLIEPENASNKNIEWSISKGEKFATIAGDGTLTALKNGITQVVASSTDGSGVKDTIEITISNQIVKVESIEIVSENGDTIISVKGGKLQLLANVFPEDASSKQVSWSIEEGDQYGNLSEDGLLEAIADGTVTINVTASDGSDVSASIKIKIINQSLSAKTTDAIQYLVTFNRETKEYIILTTDYRQIKESYLFDSSGKLIVKNIFKNKLILAHQLPGIYILKIIDDNKVERFKVQW